MLGEMPERGKAFDLEGKRPSGAKQNGGLERSISVLVNPVRQRTGFLANAEEKKRLAAFGVAGEVLRFVGSLFVQTLPDRTLLFFILELRLIACEFG